MAQIISGNQVKLNSGQTVQASQGGWYDGQQFYNGTLSSPGVINASSPQQGAGQAVSQEVIAQTNPANVAYVNQQRQQAGLAPSPIASAPQPAPSSLPGGDSSGASGTGLGAGAMQALNPPQIDLPKLYEQLYSGSGIRDIEADLNAKTMAYNAQVAKIKDNPYLSEATMTGRISKLDQKFSADRQAIQNNIAMKKADVETQLNLQTKQFDINSQQVKTAWDQFNSLLNSGALDNASGEDIANLTRSTGISSSMIQSAIGVSQKKNAPKLNTQVIQVDDGTNVNAVVINQDTGEVINKQVMGASKPKTGGGKAKESEKKQYYIESLKSDAGSGLTLSQVFSLYSGYLTPDEIYRIYNASSTYGPDKGSIKSLSKYGVTQPKK